MKKLMYLLAFLVALGVVASVFANEPVAPAVVYGDAHERGVQSANSQDSKPFGYQDKDRVTAPESGGGDSAGAGGAGTGDNG